MSTIKYKVINGTSYNEETNDTVIKILEEARINKSRVRVFYGDRLTGMDWLEENDTTGTIGRSTGDIKIPLLIKSKRSMGGGSILDRCIVKILVDGRFKWQHPAYHRPKLDIRPSDYRGYSTEILTDGVVHARFKSLEKANRWYNFIVGERLNK